MAHPAVERGRGGPAIDPIELPRPDDDDDLPPAGSLLGTIGQLAAAIGTVGIIIALLVIALVIARWVLT